MVKETKVGETVPHTQKIQPFFYLSLDIPTLSLFKDQKNPNSKLNIIP